MISREELECFDCLQWMGAGEAAARVLSCSQPRISRNSTAVQRVFGVNLKRQSEGTYAIRGHDELLAMEREIHQQFRFLGKGLLRLHVISGKGHLAMGLPKGWTCNPPGRLEPLTDVVALLESHVIDACIVQRPQIESIDDRLISVFELFRSPLYLASSADNPLVHERGVTASDLVATSELSHLCNLPLATRAATERLHAHLVGGTAHKNSGDPSSVRYPIYYVNALGLASRERLIIDFNTHFATKDYVLVLRKNVERPGVQRLLDQLRHSIQWHATQISQLASSL